MKPPLLSAKEAERLAAGTVEVTTEVRHEEALLKAGALQSAIFNSANFSSIATDEKGVIQIFNVGAERMLGYAAADVMNKITPADISDPQEVIARAKALSVELATTITPGFEALVFKASRGIEDIYELTYIRKDGSRFPAIVSVTALRDELDVAPEGRRRIIGYLLIGTDNSARKRAEEALLQAGALQSAIFNSANFSSIATDEKGVIQIFNVGAERMLGYAAADVMNKITPADISDPQEVIARAKALSVELATTITPGFEALVFKASRGIEDIYELTYIRKDGSRFPAIVSVTALRDERDRIIGYLLIGTDNTARKQVEAERQKLDQRLRDQQFYTRSLIESNIDALMTTDPLGIITDVNKQMEALTGCTRDELIGAPFKNYFTDPERAEAAIKLVLAERNVTNYELTARARDGMETVVSYNATTFYDRDRKLQGVFAAARDVTERKRFELALQETNEREQALRAAAEQATQAKDRFFAVLSHELRSPLQSMLGWVRLLRSGHLSTAHTGRALDVIERNTVLQARLIEDLLDVSRITAGVLELDLAPMLVASAVQTVIENLRPAADAKRIRLVLSIEDGAGRIQGDAARVQQIVGNLVSNAMKFTPSEGRIEVRIARRGSEVEIRVSDTGAGISSDQLPQVFAPFGTEPRKRSHGGLGLGLGIARHLAELHGGALNAASAGLGHGATFTVTLPLTVERPAADEAPDRVAASGPTEGLAGRHVLVVEDDPDAREVITLMLEDSGGVVTAAATVAAALSELERVRPDVLLSDLSLPDRDGYDFIRSVRALAPGRGGSIPAIALTAYASTEDRERVMAAGFQRCLSKPIDLPELVAAIVTLADRI